MTFVIGGLIGKVLKVDKDDGRDCIGRFLRIKVCFEVREHLCVELMSSFRMMWRFGLIFVMKGYLTTV